MKFRVKAALLALSTGMIALSTWGCVSRLLGDAIGDAIWLRGID